MEQTVTLAEYSTFDLQKLKNLQDCQAVANNTESLQKIEECVAIWIKQIEQVSIVLIFSGRGLVCY